MSTPALEFLKAELEALEAADRWRDARPACSDGLLNLCANDYLGYAREAAESQPVAGGAAASRLVWGDHPAHLAAEVAFANWTEQEAALLFSSGYAANVGVLQALAGPGDLVVSDALNHASIVDGCRLSRATVVVTPHLDLKAVETALGAPARRKWVVTESYFSMDGDVPDLTRLRELCDRAGAGLLVDEAHAIGVFGPSGRGLCALHGVVPDVLVAPCGKALGAQGAFVAGSEDLRTWLWNRARPFVFSTGVSPALAALLRSRVERAKADDVGRERVAFNSSRLRAALQLVGMGGSIGPILPCVLGSSAAAQGAAEALRGFGVLVQAIRPPTVPAGTARLRITASAALTSVDLEAACDALGKVLR